MASNRQELLKRKADIFKALGHPIRLWVVEKLEKGEACVCEFVDANKVNFSTMSNHLSVLQKAGIVSREKRGREVYYSLKMPCILQFMHCIDKSIQQQLTKNIAILKSLQKQIDKDSFRLDKNINFK